MTIKIICREKSKPFLRIVEPPKRERERERERERGREREKVPCGKMNGRKEIFTYALFYLWVTF